MCRYDDEEVEWIDSSTERYEFINSSQPQSQIPGSIPSQPITPVKEILPSSVASPSPVAVTPTVVTPMTSNPISTISSLSTSQTSSSNVLQTPEKSQITSTSTASSKMTPRTRTVHFLVFYWNRS